MKGRLDLDQSLETPGAGAVSREERDSVATVSQEMEDSPGHGAGHELGRVFLVYKVAYTATTMSLSQAGLGRQTTKLSSLLLQLLESSLITKYEGKAE